MVFFKLTAYLMPSLTRMIRRQGHSSCSTIDNLREALIHVPFNIRLDKDCGIKAGILQSYKPFRARDANVDQVSILRTKNMCTLILIPGSITGRLDLFQT